MNIIIGIMGLIVSLIPIVVLSLQIKAGRAQFVMLYIFLVLYYLSLILYSLWPDDVPLLFIYLFEMLFFLNMYRAYLQKELFFAIPAILYFNDLAIIFTFYFATFNLVELARTTLKGRKTSPWVFSSLIFFELGIILQILEIFNFQCYVSFYATIPFLIGSILFIIPGLRVAYEKEKI
ncbi:MAG TPA: hypothetical protein ENL31_01795 [Candidatus Aciduliprofundum boonei]|uniref:Histidine kinase N-terminal 7TM region domain-containing protein n=1 Tax=Candidatus Aciduliprofundum boonei TaxID=379547 RepID=A0A7J3T978_9ARCH|nr:hypothetical protein [Candidatus Aciduliprofundum boonei]